MHLEMEEIRKEDEAEKAAGFISVWKLFTMQSLRWQLISMIVLMAGQQLSGVNAVRAPRELGVQKAVCDQALLLLLPHTLRGWGWATGHPAPEDLCQTPRFSSRSTTMLTRSTSAQV